MFSSYVTLGFRFAPRIRDLTDKRLYVPDQSKNYPLLENFIGGSINRKQSLTQWPLILRLAASIKQGRLQHH
jgi:TnpA family transposase